MIRITALLVLITTSLMTKAQLKYHVSFPNRNTHYVDVSITVKPAKGSTHTEFSMPVWTPGSYKVREFSQNMDFVSASSGTKELEVKRMDKNDWRVNHQDGQEVTFNYRVYAFVKSVRQSYIDQYYAFLHGVSVFAYPKGYEKSPIRLSIKLPDDWKQVEVALPKNEDGSYQVKDYDLLADSPMAMGNFDVGTYAVDGVEHRIVMIGDGNYDLEKVTEDFKAISEEEFDLFGHMPVEPHYVHFIQNVVSGGGGLEHLNSQTSAVKQWSYSDEKAYKRFLSLVAHEYFHLWNVKRIRPDELGPFDYEHENYTKLLWQAEGFTAYYDDHFLLRTGMYNTDEYLDIVEYNINRFENTAGKSVMSVEQASYNAWIKAYYPNENSKNVTISYYNKGMLVAMMLDLLIVENSNGKRSLDDVMRMLYKHYKKTGEGFDKALLKSYLEKAAKTDLDAFFTQYIEGTEEIDWSAALNKAGVQVEEDKQDSPRLGIDLKDESGKLVVSSVVLDGPAAEAGLSVNDEFIAINGYRITREDLVPVFLEDGVPVKVTVARDGVLRTITITPRSGLSVKYSLKFSEKPSEKELMIQKKWFRQL
jgi:predicted metalloprotease with PDZ domain